MNAVNIASFINGIETAQQYNAALEYVESLFDAGDLQNPNFHIVAAHIRDYEDKTPEYAALRAQIDAIPRALGTLRTLINQYGLTFDELPEIGTELAVARVLCGEVELSPTQCAALAARFGVSPDLFID